MTDYGDYSTLDKFQDRCSQVSKQSGITSTFNGMFDCYTRQIGKNIELFRFTMNRITGLLLFDNIRHLPSKDSVTVAVTILCVYMCHIRRHLFYRFKTFYGLHHRYLHYKKIGMH